jgi:hypothetical protein
MHTVGKFVLGLMGQLRAKPAAGDSAMSVSLPPPEQAHDTKASFRLTRFSLAAFFKASLKLFFPVFLLRCLVYKSFCYC